MKICNQVTRVESPTHPAVSHVMKVCAAGSYWSSLSCETIGTPPLTRRSSSPKASHLSLLCMLFFVPCTLHIFLHACHLRTFDLLARHATFGEHFCKSPYFHFLKIVAKFRQHFIKLEHRMTHFAEEYFSNKKS